MVYHDRATKLHAESIIIDGLNISNWQEPEVFAHLHQGGLTAINATVAIWENFTETLDNIARWYPRFEKYADIIMPVKTVADIERAKAEGKCGIIFGFQNSDPIEGDLRRLRIFHELGVRVIQVAYNRSNFVGSGYAESPDYGLSNLGLDFVAECNRLGILLDCSHVGHKTTMDTIEASTKPIAFTHANARSLYNINRNKTDEELKALAAKGGVVGITGYAYFLAQKEKATLSDFVDTIDYMVRLTGIDHVGIGIDFTQCQSQEWFRWVIVGKNIDKDPRFLTDLHGQSQEWVKVRLSPGYKAVFPKGLSTPADFPNLPRALLERGYSGSDVQKIMGKNFLNLFREVWG